MRTLRLAGLAVLCGLAAEPALAEMSASFRELLVEYRCELVDRLERIHGFGDTSSHDDRFIAVTVPEHRHGYVQCMFIENGTGLYCEAASGFYYAKKGSPRTQWLEPDRVAALARLGFSTDDSEGNYALQKEIGPRPNFNAIADLILAALHDGYGARADRRLKFNAPFARRKSSSCVPVS